MQNHTLLVFVMHLFRTWFMLGIVIFVLGYSSAQGWGGCCLSWLQLCFVAVLLLFMSPLIPANKRVDFLKVAFCFIACAIYYSILSAGQTHIYFKTYTLFMHKFVKQVLLSCWYWMFLLINKTSHYYGSILAPIFDLLSKATQQLIDQVHTFQKERLSCFFIALSFYPKPVIQHQDNFVM